MAGFHPTVRAFESRVVILANRGIIIPQTPGVDRCRLVQLYGILRTILKEMYNTAWNMGVTQEEVEEVFQNIIDSDISLSSGRPVVFGDTNGGRHLMVVYEEVNSDTVYPVTAYEVPRKRER